MICERCGSAMETRREGFSLAYICNSCGWGVATTCFPPIFTDETVYRVFVTDGNIADTNHIRTVAAITGLNFLGARKLLLSQCPCIFSGKAPDVLKARNRLRKAGLATDTDPVFKWCDDDLTRYGFTALD